MALKNIKKKSFLLFFLGKSWGKTPQKSSKKCTNVLKTISPIFIEISAKTLDFTKLHKRFKHIS